MALLDSGCTKTVVGEKYLEVYAEMLGENGKGLLTYSNYYWNFRFEVVSTQKVKIPAVIGRVKINIDANVVPNSIQLLLSRDSLKK